MAIASADKLVVVKAFAPANPLPIDAREIQDSYEAAVAFAKSDATAYEGQTIKAKNTDGSIGVYVLKKAGVAGTNFTLVPLATSSDAAGIKAVAQSTVAGRITVTDQAGTATNVAAKDVMHSPVYNDATRTLIFKKTGSSVDGTDDTTITVQLDQGHQRVKDLAGEGAYDTTNGFVKTLTVSKVDAEGKESSATIKVGSIADASYNKAKGQVTLKDVDSHTKTVTLEDVAMAPVYDESTKKLTINKVAANGTLTEVSLDLAALLKANNTGSVVNPTYDADTRTITLPVTAADGSTTDTVIALGKDMVVTSGQYNTETHDIELTLTDKSVIKIPAGDLIDVYTGAATATATTTVSSDNKISVEVKKSTVEKNILKSDANGLYVLESDFTDTKALITAETTARTAKIGEIGDKTVKAYVDDAATSVTSKFVTFGA